MGECILCSTDTLRETAFQWSQFFFRFLLSDKLHPQTISCVETRAGPFGIKIEVVDVNRVDFSNKDIGGIIFQYPDTEGSIHNFSDIVSKARLVIFKLLKIYKNLGDNYSTSLLFTQKALNEN